MDVLPAVAAPAGQMAEPELESLSGRVKSGDKTAIPALARQFESVFMAQLVKEMRQTLEPGTLFGNDPGDVYGGLFDMFMGKHLAQAGGIGLGAMLTRHMEASDHSHNAPHSSSPTSNPTHTPWRSKPQTLPMPV
jgi:Rod binding domain-containing protein